MQSYTPRIQADTPRQLLLPTTAYTTKTKSKTPSARANTTPQSASQSTYPISSASCRAPQAAKAPGSTPEDSPTQTSSYSRYALIPDLHSQSCFSPISLITSALPSFTPRAVPRRSEACVPQRPQEARGLGLVRPRLRPVRRREGASRRQELSRQRQEAGVRRWHLQALS